MLTCPSCGQENPEGFRFCGACATPLEAEAVERREERKVVTVLFCDLVGFTAASEGSDPEDIRARIRPYHSLLKREIERYGGTVEKFIGDAVMAVFGAPVAHEDDVERAVRAGLRILEAIAELNEAEPSLSLHVRVGINTGEVVVDLAARPKEGEGIVTGDVVNTASRLQGAAPVDGIAVSADTYRATDRVFDYEELEPVQVKGKTEPLPLYRPLRARARFGSEVTRTHATPIVGRDLEMTVLTGTFERSAQQRSCQLVTVVGEPGVGKSRLCAELFNYVEERPGLVTWRSGRCLSYGDGISFWALGEIVKAECGILESDSPEEAAAKLEGALPQDDPDLPWLRARLAPLVGAGSERASQEESFTAWRRFLESLAAQRPTVLVFEDLHWADPALLSFIEHVGDWSEGVPLLLLCTARPELYEQHPAWAAGLRNATTINLAPLTEDDTARLISALLERAVLPAETQRALLERAGGNPLYAEEYVRLLVERGRPAGREEVPDSVQALIAARLDTLTPERKSLLQAAAVIGQVFWVGALAEMTGRDPREVEQALHELSRKELVRPARTSVMEGEAEYGFWHVLVRDVCYAQIPRAARAARHEEAAAWIERKAGGRAEDVADVLAHHYLSAVELARAAGRKAEANELEASAIHFLALAAERALALDVDRAEQNLSRALSLARAGHPERAHLLERWAQTAHLQGRLKEAKDALGEALAVHRERDEDVAAARVLTALSLVLLGLGEASANEAVADALALLEARPPGPELVDAYARLASERSANSAYQEAIGAAERALALAGELGLPPPARAFSNRGWARVSVGERQGLEDLRRALALALEQGDGRLTASQHHYLAIAAWLYEGPQSALPVLQEGIDFCERRGIADLALGMASERLRLLAEVGLPEQALAEAGPLVERLEAAGSVVFVEARSQQLRLLTERGVPEPAEAAEELVTRVRDFGEPQYYAELATAAGLLLARGRPQQAKALLVELEQVPNIRPDPYYASVLPELVRTALAVGDAELAARLVDGAEPRTPLAEHALAACRAQLAEAAGPPAEAAGLYAEAAERWREFGNVPERAYALLGQGRCLASEAQLRAARELFQALDYRPALAECDALLGKAAPSPEAARAEM